MLRFVTYNLLNGGIDIGNGSEQRRIDQAHILKPLQADVLALQECTGWEDQNWWRLYWLAQQLDLVVFDKVQTQRRTGMSSPNWTVLLYRPERLRAVGGTPHVGQGAFQHGAIRALFVDRDNADTEYRVHATHLAWTDGGARLGESRWFTDWARSRSMLLGDLNEDLCTAPQPNWSNIPQFLHSRYRLVLPDGSYGNADRRCTGNLLGAGYVDPAAHLGVKPAPTTGYWYSNEPEPQSLDHILLGAQLADDAREYRTVDTREARSASDHLPRLLCLAT